MQPPKSANPMENAGASTRDRHSAAAESTRHYPPAAFGDTLRRRRTEQGLGLRETARAAGIPPGYLVMLEQGKRSPSESVADALVDALKLTSADAETVWSAAVPGVGRDYLPDLTIRSGGGGLPRAVSPRTAGEVARNMYGFPGF